MIYVLRCSNPDSVVGDGTPTKIQLIGPFADAKAGAHWAEYREFPDINPNNPHDNPMWQICDLQAPTVEVVKS